MLSNAPAPLSSASCCVCSPRVSIRSQLGGVRLCVLASRVCIRAVHTRHKSSSSPTRRRRTASRAFTLFAANMRTTTADGAAPSVNFRRRNNNGGGEPRKHGEEGHCHSPHWNRGILAPSGTPTQQARPHQMYIDIVLYNAIYTRISLQPKTHYQSPAPSLLLVWRTLRVMPSKENNITEPYVRGEVHAA